jgi:predicted O-methyltransferase YrrM
MKSFAKDILTVILPGRRRLWKEREKAFQLQKRLLREYRALAELPQVSCLTSNLRRWDANAFKDFISDPNRGKEWGAIKEKLAPIEIPEMSGGVNPGDQRLIFHLIQYLQPKRVLEIGTHIGASTLHIAAALRFMNSGKQGALTTVDIKDVNDTDLKPWSRYGCRDSPRDMLEIIGAGQHVTFHVSDSVDFLEKATETFDFIFLDGDHSATSVYREIPLALEQLSEDGIILLHDFFPNLEPLWPEDHVKNSMIHQSVIPGPFLAAQRLEREKAGCCALPFGTLPWPTKLGTNVTSLALLVRNG